MSAFPLSISLNLIRDPHREACFPEKSVYLSALSHYIPLLFPSPFCNSIQKVRWLLCSFESSQTTVLNSVSFIILGMYSPAFIVWEHVASSNQWLLYHLSRLSFGRIPKSSCPATKFCWLTVNGHSALVVPPETCYLSYHAPGRLDWITMGERGAYLWGHSAELTTVVCHRKCSQFHPDLIIVDFVPQDEGYLRQSCWVLSHPRPVNANVS